MSDITPFLGYFEHLSYVGIGLAVALGGLLIPIPEEVVLLLVGYGIAAGFSDFWTTIAVSWFSLLVSDYVVFSLSRHGSRLLRRVQNKISQKKVQKYEAHMQAHAGKTIFVLRFTPGLRLLSMVLAGSRHVNSQKFLYADALALSIYVPVMIYLGFHFHSDITGIISHVESIRHAITLVVAALISIVIVVFVKKRFFNPN